MLQNWRNEGSGKRAGKAKIQPAMNDKSTGTPQEREINDSAEADSEISSTMVSQLNQVLSLLKPLTDFHQAVADAADHDMRMFWDVRLVRGKDTAFLRVHGTSTLSAMLAPKMLPLAPTHIESEVKEKIMAPLVSALMTEVEKMTFQDLAKRRMAGGPASGEEHPAETHRGPE